MPKPTPVRGRSVGPRPALAPEQAPPGVHTGFVRSRTLAASASHVESRCLHRIGAVNRFAAPRLAASLAIIIVSSAHCAELAQTATAAASAITFAPAAASAPALWVV